MLAGALALLFGLLAIVLRKQTPRHKPIGRIYFWSMAFVFISALYMASVKFNPFLLGVAFFSFYASLTAYRALRLKELHLGQRPTLLDWGIEGCFGLAHLVFVGFAMFQFYRGHWEMALVALLFGLFGLNGNWNTWKRFTRKPKFRRYWLLAHLGGMLGSYIAAITAFVVNNADWFPVPQLVLWLGPTLLILPFIIREGRKQQSEGGLFAEHQ